MVFTGNMDLGSCEDNRTYKARELYVLSDKMEELHRTNQQLKQAKDEAMQSWLDSRPLIDELERLQTDLANAKQHSENTVVANLESQLMEINMSIRLKREEELRATTHINDMNQVSESLREELERIKLETDEERVTRSKMKQVIKLRRQTLRTLKLTLRAVRLESEAYAASAEAALEKISRARLSDNNAMIELTQEDYFALARRAKEETSLADWRVLVATEQRLGAEENRDLGLKRLMEPKALIKNSKEGEIPEKGGSSFRSSSQSTPFPKARAKLMADGSDKQRRQVGKKKRSIFVEIKSFFARKMKYLFG